MSFTFDFNLLNALEVLGLAFAVIGFLDLSEKLEVAFGRMRVASLKYAAYELEQAKAYWPPHKHLGYLLFDIWESLPLGIVMVGTYLWLSGNFIRVRDWAIGLDLWQQGSFVLVGLLAVLLSDLFARYILNRMLAFVAIIFEWLFKIMAIPESGITGTLGLLMAIGAFALGHITTAGAP